MSRHEEEQSVFNEPHLRPDAGASDESEEKAQRTLDKARLRDAKANSASLSVFDEPDIFDGRPAELIDQDWSCSKCGYNLRGLRTGHPCPECGNVELYRPAGKDAPGYAAWLRQRVELTSTARTWAVTTVLLLIGGFWALICAFLGVGAGGPLAQNAVLLMVIFGPAVEETMKIGTAAWIVESRPYLFKHIEQLQLATVGVAAVFAAVENVVYLTIYVPNPSVELMLWRWTVCVALHTGCTLVATRGLTKVWSRTMTELRPPQLSSGVPALATAIVLHASYNAAAVLYDYIW